MEAKTATAIPLKPGKGGKQKYLKQQRLTQMIKMKKEVCEAHLHTIFAGENPEGELL